MTTDLFIQKSTKPTFILGGLILLFLGFVIASGNMKYGDKGSNITDKKLPFAVGLSIGLVIIIMSIFILRQAFVSSESAS